MSVPSYQPSATGAIKLEDINDLVTELEKVAFCRKHVAEQEGGIVNQKRLRKQLRDENRARLEEIERTRQRIKSENERHTTEVDLLNEEVALFEAGVAHALAESAQRLNQLAFASEAHDEAVSSAESLRAQLLALEVARRGEASRHALAAHAHRGEVAHSKRVVELRFRAKLGAVDSALQATAFSGLSPLGQGSLIENDRLNCELGLQSGGLTEIEKRRSAQDDETNLLKGDLKTLKELEAGSQAEVVVLRKELSSLEALIVELDQKVTTLDHAVRERKRERRTQRQEAAEPKNNGVSSSSSSSNAGSSRGSSTFNHGVAGKSNFCGGGGGGTSLQTGGAGVRRGQPQRGASAGDGKSKAALLSRLRGEASKWEGRRFEVEAALEALREFSQPRNASSAAAEPGGKSGVSARAGSDEGDSCGADEGALPWVGDPVAAWAAEDDQEQAALEQAAQALARAKESKGEKEPGVAAAKARKQAREANLKQAEAKPAEPMMDKGVGAAGCHRGSYAEIGGGGGEDCASRLGYGHSFCSSVRTPEPREGRPTAHQAESAASLPWHRGLSLQTSSPLERSSAAITALLGKSVAEGTSSLSVPSPTQQQQHLPPVLPHRKSANSRRGGSVKTRRGISGESIFARSTATHGEEGPPLRVSSAEEGRRLWFMAGASDPAAAAATIEGHSRRTTRSAGQTNLPANTPVALQIAQRKALDLIERFQDLHSRPSVAVPARSVVRPLNKTSRSLGIIR